MRDKSLDAERLLAALQGLIEEFAASVEGRKSKYKSLNGVCAFDNARAALKAAGGSEI